MNKILAVSALVCTLAITPALSGQRTLVVDLNGGTPFTTISAAIAAAAPGDTVFVRAGSYNEELDVDKGIRLVGDGALLRRGIFSLFSVDVHDLPVDQSFSMIGFAPDGSGPSAFDAAVAVRDCSGSVALAGLAQNHLAQWYARVENSDQVHISGSVLRSAVNFDSDVVYAGVVFDPEIFAALSITGGRVACVQCSIRGGNGVFGGPAIWLVRGELALTRSTVRGTQAGPNFLPAIETAGGAIILDPSAVLSAGGGGPLIAGPAAVATREFASITSSSDGSTARLDLHGPAGAGFATVLSLPRPRLSTPLGLTWLDPEDNLVVELGIIPTGRLWTRTIGHAPLPPGTTFALQSVFFGSYGFELSTPSLLTMP